MRKTENGWQIEGDHVCDAMRARICPEEEEYGPRFEVYLKEGRWRLFSESDPHYNDFIIFCPYCGLRLGIVLNEEQARRGTA